MVLVGAFLVLLGAFFRTQVDSARQVPAQGRDQPAPPDSAHAAPGNDPRPQRPGHRRERARLLGQAAGSVGRFAPGGARPGAAVRAAGQRPGHATSSSATLQARYQPALVFGDASFEVIAKLEEHRSAAAGSGDSGRAQAALSRREIGGSPGRLRLRGDRGRSGRRSLSRRRARARSWARPGWSGSTTTRSGATKGSATSR